VFLSIGGGANSDDDEDDGDEVEAERTRPCDAAGIAPATPESSLWRSSDASVGARVVTKKLEARDGNELRCCARARATIPGFDDNANEADCRCCSCEGEAPELLAVARLA